MELLLLICFFTICIYIFIVYSNKNRLFQFPFWASLFFIVFLGLPLIGLLNVNYLPIDGYARYTFMAILCFVMLIVGHKVGSKVKLSTGRKYNYNSKKWLNFATILIFIGGVFSLKNLTLFYEESDMMSGESVANNFFIPLLRYGFFMALLHYYRYKSKYALILILGSVFIFYFPMIVFFARRQIMFEFVFVLISLRWFVKKKGLARKSIYISIFFGILVLYSTGKIRDIVVSTGDNREWSKIPEIGFAKTTRSILVEGSPEIESAIYSISAADYRSEFDFGLFNWNILVFNYVPSQIFGTSFKNSLMSEINDPKLTAQYIYNYEKLNGSTSTGIVDSFGSFWYFGSIKYFIIGLVMQILYRKAKNGNIQFQLIYVFMLTMAIHAITHNTNWFLSPWVHILVFWIPVFFLCRKKSKRILIHDI